MGEYGKALADYDQAIDLRPDFANAHLSRGKAYANMGEYEKAKDCYLAAKSFDPNLRVPLTAIGISLWDDIRVKVTAGSKWARIPIARGLASYVNLVRLRFGVVPIIWIVGSSLAILGLLPMLASMGLEAVLPSVLLANIVEASLRLGMVYVPISVLFHFSPELRKNHAAEHMVIQAMEDNAPLGVEAVRKYSKSTYRCSSVRLFITLLLMTLAILVMPREPLWWLVISRIVLIPFSFITSDEVVRLLSRHPNNPLTKMFFGMLTFLEDKLVLEEPEDVHIQLAIDRMEKELGHTRMDIAV